MCCSPEIFQTSPSDSGSAPQRCACEMSDARKISTGDSPVNSQQGIEDLVCCPLPFFVQAEPQKSNVSKYFFFSSDKPDLDHPLFSAGKLLIMFVNDCYFYRPTTLLWSQRTSKNVQCWKKRHSFIIFDPLEDHFWINTDTQQRVFYVLKSFKPFTSHLLISNINLSVLVFLLVSFYHVWRSFFSWHS